MRRQEKTELFYNQLGVDTLALQNKNEAFFFVDANDSLTNTGMSVTITIECNDLDATLRVIENLGFKILHPFTMAPWGPTITVIDPDGRAVILYQKLEGIGKYMASFNK
jgi:predicted enzyme related to lactoylglutathione lyase